MLDNYLPIMIFIAIGIAIGVGPIVLGFLLSPHKPDAEKNSPFECGFEAFEDTRMRFDVRYYLVAILFIIFEAGPFCHEMREASADETCLHLLFSSIERRKNSSQYPWLPKPWRNCPNSRLRTPSRR